VARRSVAAAGQTRHARVHDQLPDLLALARRCDVEPKPDREELRGTVVLEV
jgi:hypothetical protein